MTVSGIHKIGGRKVPCDGGASSPPAGVSPGASSQWLAVGRWDLGTSYHMVLGLLGIRLHTAATLLARDHSIRLYGGLARWARH